MTNVPRLSPDQALRGSGVVVESCEGTTAFVAHALRNPLNREILQRLAASGLPDCWLVAGCLFQAVWNGHVGRAPHDGVKDYDIFYHDAADLSWEAEDRAIAKLRADLADLDLVFDLKNQARVHLWYAQRFGAPYPELTNACDGIDRFLVAGTCIGLKQHADGHLALYAPFGLADCIEGVLRPNPLNTDAIGQFQSKAESYRARWPHLIIDPTPAPLPNRTTAITRVARP